MSKLLWILILGVISLAHGAFRYHPECLDIKLDHRGDAFRHLHVGSECHSKGGTCLEKKDGAGEVIDDCYCCQCPKSAPTYDDDVVRFGGEGFCLPDASMTPTSYTPGMIGGLYASFVPTSQYSQVPTSQYQIPQPSHTSYYEPPQPSHTSYYEPPQPSHTSYYEPPYVTPPPVYNSPYQEQHTASQWSHYNTQDMDCCRKFPNIASNMVFENRMKPYRQFCEQRKGKCLTEDCQCCKCCAGSVYDPSTDCCRPIYQPPVFAQTSVIPYSMVAPALPHWGTDYTSHTSKSSDDLTWYQNEFPSYGKNPYYYMPGWKAQGVDWGLDDQYPQNYGWPKQMVGSVYIWNDQDDNYDLLGENYHSWQGTGMAPPGDLGVLGWGQYYY